VVGRIIKKTGNSTVIFSNGRLFSLPFVSKHNTGDIIDLKDNLLNNCLNTKPLNILKKAHEYYTKKFRFLKSIRDFFTKEGFIEVYTPKLKKNIIIEPNINYIKTANGILAPSPEVEIKKLLSLGFDKIFELCWVYRDDMKDNLHKQEFLMLEFYEVLSKPYEIINRLIKLIKYISDESFKGRYNLDTVEYIEYKEAFKRFANLDTDKTDLEKLKIEFNIEGDVSIDEILDLIFGLKVEKQLGKTHPMVIYNFPAGRASLAKVIDNKTQRYEFYLGGVELANCYLEQIDAKLIEERFCCDEVFFKAMEFGLPPLSGIAVGVERLFMVLEGFDGILEEWIWQNF